MRKAYLSISALLIFTITLIGQKPIEGFRDLSWGESLSDAKEKITLNEQEKTGKVTIFASPTDSHQIGTVELKEIYYFFHDNAGFFKVVMSGDGSENEDMDAILKNRLGPNSESILNPSHTYNVWINNDVTVVYKQQLSEDFVISIRSEAITKYERQQNQMITDF